MGIFRNLRGTSESTFQLGLGDSPILTRVGATARLQLSNLLRWLPGGSAVSGFLNSDSSGDLSIIQTNLNANVPPASTDDSTAGYAVGSRWIDTTNDQEYVCVDSTASNAVWVGTTVGGTFVFGSNYEQSESLVVSTTTSETFQTKLSFTTAVLPIGSYRIGWSYGWNHDSTTTNFLGQILIDSALEMEHVQEPKDSSGGGPTGTTQRYRASGHIYKTYGTATTHTIEVEYATSNAGTESSIWDTRIEIWRVL